MVINYDCIEKNKTLVQRYEEVFKAPYVLNVPSIKFNTIGLLRAAEILVRAHLFAGTSIVRFHSADLISYFAFYPFDVKYPPSRASIDTLWARIYDSPNVFTLNNSFNWIFMFLYNAFKAEQELFYNLCRDLKITDYRKDPLPLGNCSYLRLEQLSHLFDVNIAAVKYMLPISDLNSYILRSFLKDYYINSEEDGQLILRDNYIFIDNQQNKPYMTNKACLALLWSLAGTQNAVGAYLSIVPLAELHCTHLQAWLLDNFNIRSKIVDYVPELTLISGPAVVHLELLNFNNKFDNAIHYSQLMVENNPLKALWGRCLLRPIEFNHHNSYLISYFNELSRRLSRFLSLYPPFREIRFNTAHDAPEFINS